MFATAALIYYKKKSSYEVSNNKPFQGLPESHRQLPKPKDNKLKENSSL
jgi:hypothetical protein